MKYKKNTSGLSDHVLEKKKGIIVTPLNHGLGDLLKLNSWSKERLPEYLWLGLILQAYGRKDGFKKSIQILQELSKSLVPLNNPCLSVILSLTDEEQIKVYKTISKIVDKRIMSPLTIIYRRNIYPIFNDYFFIPQFRAKDRIEVLSKAIKIYTPSKSHEAADLRFLVVVFRVLTGKLIFPANAMELAKFLEEYPFTDHEDEKMKTYRPNVRCMEPMGFEEDVQFNLKFWRDIGMITPCNPWGIEFKKNSEDYKKIIYECRKILEYVLVSHKEESLKEDKFDIIVGSTNYVLKIFAEIDSNFLGNSILGRHGIRTIIEIYIMLKYLLKKENEKPDIWKEYKAYGIGKYKLVLLKARESQLNKSSHFTEPIVDAIVNEHSFEEFTDVDLKYFDKQSIREKSIDVGEKELYDLFYDYDSSFSHGLWGAIRESAMIACDNASHQYHGIPDVSARQNLSDIKSDCMEIMKKLFCLLSEIYQIPDNLITWTKND